MRVMGAAWRSAAGGGWVCRVRTRGEESGGKVGGWWLRAACVGFRIPQWPRYRLEEVGWALGLN